MRGPPEVGRGRRARLRGALALGVVLGACAGLLAPASARASGGSYASAGSGTYAASLWWLDFSGYSNATAAGGGQGYSWTLPGGAGTLAATVSVTGNGTLVATGLPTWSGGGALGHGAYNGVAGSPSLYWLNQPGSTVTLTLGGLAMRDAAGYARSYALYAADAENTNSGESITYTSSAAWKLVDSVNYYAGYTGGLVQLAGTGTATVKETAPASSDGNYNSSVVLGTLAPTGVTVAMTNNEAVVFAIAMPTVSLTVTVAGRVATGDEFTASVGYTSPAATLKSVTSAGTATTVTSGTVTVIGSNSLTLSASLATGSPSSLAYYGGSIACTNTGPGGASFTGAATVLPAGAGTSFNLTPQGGDAISCTLTLAPVTQTLTGTVYGDANYDGTLDNGETGTGLSGLYVKLAPYVGGSCQATATAAAAVATATGAYSVPAVAPGGYCLTLTNSPALSNTTPYLPAGYVGTEAASGVRTLNIGAGPAAVQNFGLYFGATLSVTVYDDNGAGGGTANDGVQNGAEAGLGGITIGATSGATQLASATTAANGTALLWLPGSAQGATVTVTPVPPGGYLATGGSAGATGGSYARPSVSFRYTAGGALGGVAFGLVPPNTYAPDNAQSALPGTTLYYAHTYVAASAGQLAFTTTAIASPAIAGYGEVVYADPACSGQYAATDTPVAATQAVVAGQTVCVLVREFVPATAPPGAQNKVTVSAAFVYSGAAAPAPVTLAHTDTTTVGGSGEVTLYKQVQNLSLATAYGTSNSGAPGQTLQYLLTIANLGAAPLHTVVVNDATPAYTTFVSAACPAPAALPAGLTACSVTSAPATGGQGGLSWSFTGTMAPGSQTAVSYQVQIAP